MKRQLDRIHYAIAVVLFAIAVAVIVLNATAAPDSSPPELATQTVPAIDPYPPPYPGPLPSGYPAYLPFQAGQPYP